MIRRMGTSLSISSYGNRRPKGSCRGPGWDRAFASAALLLVACTSVVAEVDLPPRGERSVYDLAGVISPGHRDIMERTHKDLLARTGVTLSVVTFPRLEGGTLETLLARAAPAWGLGEAAGDRGIVVALAIEEKRVLIASGQ